MLAKKPTKGAMSNKDLQFMKKALPKMNQPTPAARAMAAGARYAPKTLRPNILKGTLRGGVMGAQKTMRPNVTKGILRASAVGGMPTAGKAYKTAMKGLLLKKMPKKR